MPIYEFYCRSCHRVYSFLSRAVDTGKTPACPRCGAADMTRRASAFAISRGRREEPSPEPAPGDLDDPRLERAMEAMAGELDTIDENDPRQGARLMRKLFSATGMPVGSQMEEALRRMESGEEPERIEEQMGDVLDTDPLAGLLGGGGQGAERTPEARPNLGRLRRLLPPSHDPELYELT